MNSGFPFPFNAVPFEAFNQEEHVRIVGFREKFNPFPHGLQQHHEQQLSHQHPPTGDHQQSALKQLFTFFFSGNKSTKITYDEQIFPKRMFKHKLIGQTKRDRHS